MAVPASVTQPNRKVVGELERLIDTVGAPRKAFESIEAAPGIWLSLCLLVAIRLAIMFTYFAPSVQPGKLIVTFVLALVPVLIQVTLIVGCIWFAVIAFGGETSVRKVSSLAASVLAIEATLRFAWAAVEHLLGVAESGAKGPVFSNLGFLVPESDFALRQLFGAIDVITFYVVITIGFGLPIIARKLSPGKAMIAASAPWVIYTLFSFGFKLLVT